MRHTIPTPFLSRIRRGTVLRTMPKIPGQGIFMSVSTASLNEAGILAYNDGHYAEAFKQFDAAARTGDPAGQHLLASLSPGPWRDARCAESGGTVHGGGASGLPAVAGQPGPDVCEWRWRRTRHGAIARLWAPGGRGGRWPVAIQPGAGLPQGRWRTARLWYKQAAEAGSLSAQNEYGLLYAQGQGVGLDYVQAYAWIAMPAEAGSAQSIKNRDQLLEILTPSQQQAARLLAAEYGTDPH